MWQSTYSAPGADYGVQSKTVDLDFVMRPFTFTGVSACNGKTAAPVMQNDTRTDELHMDGKDATPPLRRTNLTRRRAAAGLLDNKR